MERSGMGRRVGSSPSETAGGKRGIRAVAELAGVSIATVSRVVSGAQSVDAKLTRKVWKAVGETGYVPNRHAQALISGRTNLLGLLIADITNPFFPELVRGFDEAAVAQGFSTLVGSTNGDHNLTSAWVQRMLQHGVEGVAMLTFMSEPAHVYELLRNTPSVQVRVGKESFGTQTVEVDYRHGIRQAVQHLAVLGHRHIVFAAGSPDDFTAALREQCFREAMREIGTVVDENALFEEHHTLEGGIAAAQRILALPVLPTGLLCSNDLMAIGALRTFSAHGIRVPDDISLIGLDDIHIAEFTSPPLTTVKLPRIDLAQECFGALFAKLRPERSGPCNPRSIATSLVVRESTNYPRQSALSGHK